MTTARQDGLREALRAAYLQGALDVHGHWLENPGETPRGVPEFGEAASDYAAAALDPFDSSARGALSDISPLANERKPVPMAAATIQKAVLGLPFANTAPIEWDDADWHSVRRALSRPLANDTGALRERKTARQCAEEASREHGLSQVYAVAETAARIALSPDDGEGK